MLPFSSLGFNDNFNEDGASLRSRDDETGADDGSNDEIPWLKNKIVIITSCCEATLNASEHHTIRKLTDGDGCVSHYDYVCVLM